VEVADYMDKPRLAGKSHRLKVTEVIGRDSSILVWVDLRKECR